MYTTLTLEYLTQMYNLFPATCSPMIGPFVAGYHDVGVNKYRVVIMTPQTPSLEKYGTGNCFQPP